MSCVNFLSSLLTCRLLSLCLPQSSAVFKPEKLVSVIDLIKTDSLSIFESQTWKQKIVFWKLIYGCCYILELPLFGLERNSELVFPSDITTSVMTWWCLLRVWEKFRFTILNPWELSIWFGALRDIYHVAIITNELFCNLFIKKIQLEPKGLSI